MCTAGTYATAGSGSCTACSSGQYSDDGARWVLEYTRIVGEPLFNPFL